MGYNIDKLSERLQIGVRALSEYGFVNIEDNGIGLSANAGTKIIIEKSQDKVHIAYDTEPHFYMALARSMGLTDGQHEVQTKVERLGLMVDCSRNAVAKPNTVKRMISFLVMAGYDYLELYTEDTYEIPGEPYFGYKRGRYSTEELKEIVAFADIFSFEMVPCIQTLAHLKNLANWKPYFDHMDIDDILLVGDERTYNLIRKSIRHCKEVFHTQRINIGGDEAFHLGRGKYTDENGYKSIHEVYLEHMTRVFQICKEEGVCPEFWADGFYNMERPVEEMQAMFDGTQLPIAWTYGHQDGEIAREYFHKLSSYAGKVMFAGALWKWFGYAPFNRYSQKAIDVLLDASEECGVENVMLTAWGDNGNECSPFAVIPSMWYAAHKLFPCDADINEIIIALTGYSKEEWESCDDMNYVMPHLERMNNAAKYLLYNDYMIGLVDYNIPDHAGDIYRELMPKYLKLAERDSQFSYLFASYAELSRVLIRKATYGKRLYKAYQENDRNEMGRLIEELEEIKKDVQSFYDAYRNQWMKENKGFGFEVMDVRIGVLIVRADTVAKVLKDYLAGKTEKIYELEEERIDYWCDQLYFGEEIYAPIHGLWSTAYTVNHI